MKYIINENKFDFLPDQLFCIGCRDNNPKRSFLFISKLLGKHISTSPELVKATGYLLSSLKYGFDNKTFIDCIKGKGSPDYNQRAEDKDILVIGFCETATALGMSVASSIRGSYYQATTREKLVGINQLLSFEESHSHASTHCMFNNERSLDDFNKVILVDDEITTGNSLLNLITEIIQKSKIREFTVMTILDWRTDEYRKKFDCFAEQYNIKVDVYSIICGTITHFDDENRANNEIPVICESIAVHDLNSFKRVKVDTMISTSVSYLHHTGMLGVRYSDIEGLEESAEEASDKLGNILGDARKLLVLGHGENIYIPSRIASYLEKKGYDVRFRTTSRTPIFCDGEIIKDAVKFISHGDVYHFYNVQDAEMYDAVVMIANNEFNYKLCDNVIIFNA